MMLALAKFVGSLLLAFGMASAVGWVAGIAWGWFVVPLGAPAISAWHAAALCSLGYMPHVGSAMHDRIEQDCKENKLDTTWALPITALVVLVFTLPGILGALYVWRLLAGLP